VLVSDFDYHLPEELIAQEPLAARAASRMLHLVRETGRVEDRWFRELACFVPMTWWCSTTRVCSRPDCMDTGAGQDRSR
jgi:S-adenosylmethionine:tRNA-ribosyltransferase-isomerase (queuine synthetase)